MQNYDFFFTFANIVPKIVLSTSVLSPNVTSDLLFLAFFAFTRHYRWYSTLSFAHAPGWSTPP